VELLHGRSELSLAEKISKPVLLLPAGNDSKHIHPGGCCAVALAKKFDVPESEVTIPFNAMVHGWVSRGSSEDEVVSAEKEKAVLHLVDFARKHWSS
jgi:hypothetical protein